MSATFWADMVGGSRDFRLKEKMRIEEVMDWKGNLAFD